MRAASYAPGQGMSTTFVVSADDVSLHFDLNKLTERQLRDNAESQSLVGLLQVAQMGLGGPADHVMLYDEFAIGPWPQRLEAYAGFFTRMGANPIPAKNRHIHPVEGFYNSIAADLPDTDSITLYLTSGSNDILHNDPADYAISQKVNSKIHFAAHAPGFGIPVPDTLVTTKGQLGSSENAAFMAKYDGQVMVKILGMGAARNVSPVPSLAEAIDYVAEFEDDMEVILQHRLDLSKYTDMTADLTITDTDVSISNVRKIMFAEGVWVGNYISPNIVMPPEHEKELLRIGAYARAQGYVAPEGLNCGVDYFFRTDTDGTDSSGEFFATEINCRWTGGLFATEIIRQVGASQESCFAFIDLVIGKKFDAYLAFVDRHLFGTSSESFSIIPLGCSPSPQQIEGAEHFYTWQAIAGDFNAFKQARRDELGDGALMLAENIKMNGVLGLK